jgi:hypothetical protein
LESGKSLGTFAKAQAFGGLYFSPVRSSSAAAPNSKQYEIQTRSGGGVLGKSVIMMISATATDGKSQHGHMIDSSSFALTRRKLQHFKFFRFYVAI